jgi:ABC-2 type transport system permease protein
MFRTIWSKSLRDYRIPILGWGIGLGLIMLIEFVTATPSVITGWASVGSSTRFFGDSFASQTIEGYVTARLLEVIVPIVLSIWPILAGARLVRGEEERGTLDVVLATPQPRARVMLEKVAALTIAMLLIAVLTALGTVAGEAAMKTNVDFVRALLTALNLSLLAFFFGMLAMLFSQFTVSRKAASGWASGLMVLAFLLDGTGRVVDGAWVKYLSPFYYYNLNRPLIPSFNDSPMAALLLIGLSLLCIVLSVVYFVRRDSGRPTFSWQLNQVKDNNHVARSLRRAERDLSVRAIWLRVSRAQVGAAFWWLIGIVFYVGWCVLLIPSVKAPFVKALQQSPTVAKLFLSQGIGTDAGFLGFIVFTFLPILVVTFALTLAMHWASELDNGRLELVLSTPKSRQRVLLENFLSITLLVVLLSICTWLALMVGGQVANLHVDQGNIMAASFSMLPLALVIIGLVYALAGRLRYGAVLGILTLYIAGAYLLVVLGSLLNVPDWVVSLSIFHQYGNPIVDGMNWSAFLGMMGVAFVLLLIGLVQFQRADVKRG